MGHRTSKGDTARAGEQMEAAKEIPNHRPLTSQYGDLVYIIREEMDLTFSRSFMAICWKNVIMVM